MRTRALRDEYLSAMRAMTLEDAGDLLAARIPIETIAAVCPAPSKIRRQGERRYQPDASGGRAHIFPAMAIDPERPDLVEAEDPREAISTGAIVDLVAVGLKAPNRWALRVGAASVLGAIEPQLGLFANPVPVHRDVLAWLRSGCRGIVLLTRDPHEAGRILRSITVPQAEDEHHKAEIDRLLTMPFPLRSAAVVRA